MADGIGSFTFSELHLLPSVVFAIGAALFVSALLGHNMTLAATGLGLVFAALAYNFFYDSFCISYCVSHDGVPFPF